MKKKILLVLSAIILVVSIGMVILQGAASVDACYKFCKKYDTFKEFAACMDGCLFVPQQ